MSEHASTSPLTGLFVLDKPHGMSSTRAVGRVRRAAGGVKTGHAGTLDPAATGVLICCIGRAATRRVEQLMTLPKTYVAQVDLSAFTTTDDSEGERQVVDVPVPPAQADIEVACGRFVGSIMQRPPAHSALRVAGRRAYHLARRGEAVQLSPRSAQVHAITLLAYTWPIATIEVHCGRGTYMRSLARDLGRELGTGGTLASLRRTAVGPYTLEHAYAIERCERAITQAELLPVPGDKIAD